jgi:hypothetical protein
MEILGKMMENMGKMMEKWEKSLKATCLPFGKLKWFICR